MSTSESEYVSFHIEPPVGKDEPNHETTGVALEKMKNPFIYDVVRAFSETLSKEQIKMLHSRFNDMWDKYMDSDAVKAKCIDHVPGGEQLLHVMMNMVFFREAFHLFKTINDIAKADIIHTEEDDDDDDDDEDEEEDSEVVKTIAGNVVSVAKRPRQ
jgi:Ran GTPase-activating protein (RanGAP) involved in mRNA processing and transport